MSDNIEDQRRYKQRQVVKKRWRDKGRYNMRKFVSKLGHFNYTIHNLIAHPLMELLHLVGLTDLGNKVHDATLPLRHDE